MLTLIIGGSGSGKSAYAERYAEAVSAKQRKYYIATMEIHDRETLEKAERHRKQRFGKGFFTIEQSVDIERAAEQMPFGKGTVLLECISNLTANEMFAEGSEKSGEAAVKKIREGIAVLKEETDRLIIVTNNVFEDGWQYDALTMEYIRAMGTINRQLANMADHVIEVVAGIPVILKGTNIPPKYFP